MDKDEIRKRVDNLERIIGSLEDGARRAHRLQSDTKNVLKTLRDVEGQFTKLANEARAEVQRLRSEVGNIG